MRQPETVPGTGAAGIGSRRFVAGAKDGLRAVRLPYGALVFVAVAIAACLVLAINETRFARSNEALARLEQRAQAVVRINAAVRRLLDAETAVRGHLLTGRSAYLAPYRDAAADTTANLEWLRRHYAGNAASTALLARFRDHAAAHFAALATLLSAFDASGGERTVARVGSNGSLPAHMETLRQLADELMVRERDAVTADRQAVFDTLRNSRFGINATTAIGVLVLFMLVRQNNARDTVQREHTLALQAEHERLESEVRERTADLSSLARHLQTVREDESRRLARVLNEELGALLTAARLDVTRLRHSLGAGRADVTTRLDHLDAGLESGIALKRRIIDHLHPISLANLGLVAALRIQLREFAERTGVRVQTELQDIELPEAAQITVYRMVQEALTNIAKYAQAQQVTVRLREAAGTAGAGDPVVLTVADDGRGFQPGSAGRGAHGLMGMRYRVEAIGGTLSVQSAPGRGTRLEATLPTTATA